MAETSTTPTNRTRRRKQPRAHLTAFASQLGELRSSRSWSRRQLAERVNVSPESVKCWEDAVDLPRPDVFVRLAGALGVTTNELEAPLDAVSILRLRWGRALGVRLGDRRRELGLSSDQVARAAHAHRASVVRWEAGATTPLREQLIAVLAALSLTPDDLVTMTGEVAGRERSALCRLLQSRRAALGLSQQELCVRLDVSPGTYAAWETGRTVPGPEHVERLADKLDISVDDVMAAFPPLRLSRRDRSSFGDLVSTRRSELRLTQAELAARLGVSRSAVGHWESSTGTPPVQMVPLLAKALDVAPAELVSRLAPQARLAPVSDLGTLITARRRELGLTVEQLAERLGVFRHTVTRWTTGQSQPREPQLERLADLLAVPLDELSDLAQAQPGSRSSRKDAGSRIASARKAAGFSRAQLADKVGVAAKMVGYWERGVHEPSATRMDVLAKTLSVSAEDLTGPPA